MTSFLGVGPYVMFLALVVIGCMCYYIPRDDRRFGWLLLLAVFPIHFGVLWLFNNSTPFVASETDTFSYYNYSMRVFQTLGDYFNLQATRDALYGFEGTTFTHLLTIINQFVGDSLLLRKLLNVAALWVMAFAWYGVARLAGGSKFARTVTLFIVLLPTLWYPFCVLYRDELTSSLHSVFFASLLLLVYGKRTELIRHTIAACGATLSLFLLRPGAIYINAAIAVAVMGGSLLARNKSKVARYTVVAGICAMALYIIVVRTNLLDVLRIEKKISLTGIVGQGSTYDSQAPATITGRVRQMVPLFMISEPTVISRGLDIHDPEQYRGIMNGPWLLLGAPFAALGIWGIVKFIVRRRRLTLAVRRQNRLAGNPGATAVSIVDIAAIGVPAAIVGYCLVWLAVSMYVWDWTRWRLPAVPALVLVAVWGFKKTSIGGRAMAMGGWTCVLIAYRLIYR